MTNSRQAEDVKSALEALPHVVSVDEITVRDDIIDYLSIETKEIGRVAFRRLEENDAPELFEFYSEGLSEKPRRLFAPYPLFHTPPRSARELASRIKDWGKENDWTTINLFKDGRIIGLCQLKRFKSERATSGIAVRDEFLKKGLGYLLQSIIIQQARLLNLKSFHVKIVSDNYASLRLHEKCGFRQTRVLPSMYEDILEYLRDTDRMDGNDPVDRHIVELVIDLPDVI
jgi:RimJ/RimL family protein N-acetyltransferase